ncbi:MAG: hypothetical protein QMD06_05170 [Candidatus Altarchaeum sp.]|nr:hypothetical protein [Candidatus Altarchaeum sp.]
MDIKEFQFGIIFIVIGIILLVLLFVLKIRNEKGKNLKINAK